jgi:hypothetical protein
MLPLVESEHYCSLASYSRSWLRLMQIQYPGMTYGYARISTDAKTLAAR